MTDRIDPAFVDEVEEPDPELNRMTNAIIGACIEVHRRLGPGHLEQIYHDALAIELAYLNIPFIPRHPISIQYRGHWIGKRELDFLVFDKVVLELKAVEAVSPVHKAQIISYLKITGYPLGLLINFNVVTLHKGVMRFAGPSQRRPLKPSIEPTGTA